jgi:hypothetical protein
MMLRVRDSSKALQWIEMIYLRSFIEECPVLCGLCVLQLHRAFLVPPMILIYKYIYIHIYTLYIYTLYIYTLYIYTLYIYIVSHCQRSAGISKMVSHSLAHPPAARPFCYLWEKCDSGYDVLRAVCSLEVDEVDQLWVQQMVRQFYDHGDMCFRHTAYVEYINQ